MNRTHGLNNHPLYIKWLRIKAVCYNKKHPKYHRYGGRGVVMCDEWLGDFKKFYDWCMGNGWAVGLQVDKDMKAAKLGKDGLIYSPEWCSIISNAENANYRKQTQYITINGETKNIMQWCNHFKIKQSTFYHRVNVQGLSPSEALKKPPRKSNRNPIPPRSKINFGIAEKIRLLHNNGASNVNIAKAYKIDPSTVSTIVNNKSWIK